MKGDFFLFSYSFVGERKEESTPKEQHNSFQAEVSNIHNLLCASADTDPPAL